MPARVRWLLLLLILAALLPAAHLYWRSRVGSDGTLAFRLSWTAACLLFGVVLLGVLARWLASGTINGWRAGTLFGGALLAAIEVWVVTGGGTRAFSLEIWMAALLGLALALILPRWVPDRWLRHWLALERRGQESPPATPI
jgi:hypothetical protein